MQEWHLSAGSPLSLRFAADARLKRTDYTDDQSWEIALGGPEEPFLTFQTRYGGRVNLARLAPMWAVAGRVLYTVSALVERPIVRAFAPSYGRVTAQLTETLSLSSELFIFESRTAGGRFTLHNAAESPVAVRLELVAQALREEKPLDMHVLSLEDGTEALHLGRAGNLNPILVLENAKAPPPRFAATPQAPKLISVFEVPARGSFALRWVHSGQVFMKDSLQTAFFWLRRADWAAELRRIEQLSAQTLSFETGDPDWDAALAFSQQVALRSFVNATGSLPYDSFVSARIPSRGWSRAGMAAITAGNGAGRARSWRRWRCRPWRRARRRWRSTRCATSSPSARAMASSITSRAWAVSAPNCSARRSWRARRGRSTSRPKIERS